MTIEPDDRPGHAPTLIACFPHFDVCFMLWVLVGALGGFIFAGSGIDAGLKGLIVGVPILTGSLLRIPLGLLSDRRVAAASASRCSSSSPSRSQSAGWRRAHCWD